jgi:predicted nucleic acid-binding protein
LTSLSEDSTVEIIPLSEVLFDRAFTFYQSCQDKEWGITDCISFVVMQDRGLTDALTADDHFQQAGYRVLLKEF